MSRIDRQGRIHRGSTPQRIKNKLGEVFKITGKVSILLLRSPLFFLMGLWACICGVIPLIIILALLFWINNKFGEPVSIILNISTVLILTLVGFSFFGHDEERGREAVALVERLIAGIQMAEALRIQQIEAEQRRLIRRLFIIAACVTAILVGVWLIVV